MKIRKLIALASLTLGLGCIIAFKPVSVGEARAEGEEETAEVVQQVEEKQNKFLDTVVAPLFIALGSVNLASIGSCVGLFFWKKHKDNARFKKVDALTLKVENLIGESENLKEEAAKTQSQCVALYDAQIIELKEAVALLKETEKNTRNVDEMKKSIVVLGELIIKSIKENEDSIKSGAASKIAEVEEILKSLSK